MKFHLEYAIAVLKFIFVVLLSLFFLAILISIFYSVDKPKFENSTPKKPKQNIENSERVYNNFSANNDENKNGFRNNNVKNDNINTYNKVKISSKEKSGSQEKKNLKTIENKNLQSIYNKIFSENNETELNDDNSFLKATTDIEKENPIQKTLGILKTNLNELQKFEQNVENPNPNLYINESSETLKEEEIEKSISNLVIEKEEVNLNIDLEDNNETLIYEVLNKKADIIENPKDEKNDLKDENNDLKDDNNISKDVNNDSKDVNVEIIKNLKKSVATIKKENPNNNTPSNFIKSEENPPQNLDLLMFNIDLDSKKEDLLKENKLQNEDEITLNNESEKQKEIKNDINLKEVKDDEQKKILKDTKNNEKEKGILKKAWDYATITAFMLPMVGGFFFRYITFYCK